MTSDSETGESASHCTGHEEGPETGATGGHFGQGQSLTSALFWAPWMPPNWPHCRELEIPSGYVNSLLLNMAI